MKAIEKVKSLCKWLAKHQSEDSKIIKFNKSYKGQNTVKSYDRRGILVSRHIEEDIAISDSIPQIYSRLQKITFALSDVLQLP